MVGPRLSVKLGDRDGNGECHLWSRDQRRHSEVVAVLHTDAPVDNGQIALYKETRQANR